MTTARRVLEGRVAIVTGGSRGIGRAIALELGQAGAALVLVGRDEAALQRTADEAAVFGVAVHHCVADVRQEAQITALKERVVSEVGGVDILVNAAGINLRKPLEDFSAAEWHDVLDSNLTSAFLMCRAVLPLMRGRGYGRIINIGSTMSHVSLAGRTAYSASKAGLLGLTRALALELAGDGITVVAISPGPFATELNASLMTDETLNAQILSRVPLGSWGDPRDIGQLALFLCSEAGRFITGSDILVDGGWTAQ
jgi:NAD(P)-dependent dehydrogenase (short-subunit alcohol dehydrogenase family)